VVERASPPAEAGRTADREHAWPRSHVLAAGPDAGGAFLFAPSPTACFNDDGSFHSKAYLIETWGRLYGLLFFAEHGLDGYQDLSVWRKW
jgi:hypothetical protein